MRVRFLLGPAGSGKTHRCLAEIRATLATAPEGPPLVLLAPKQMTYQIERDLLADDSLPGYTRLQVLSFERLAFWMLDQLGEPESRLLDAEGRVMVLRALLTRKRSQLRLFRASARLTGFAQELSAALAEFQSHSVTPDQLRAIAARLAAVEGVAAKLGDFALLLEAYLAWLNQRGLQDAGNLLDVLVSAMHRAPAQPRITGLWVDGFAEFAPQEVAVLATLAPHCEHSTITFCLDREPKEPVSWLSTWSAVRQSCARCRDAFAGLLNCRIQVEMLPCEPSCGRFAGSPMLRQLEEHWAEPESFAEEAASRLPQAGVTESPPARFRDGAVSGQSLRVVVCANAEAEAVFAARKVMRFVRAGGRFRDVTVLVRDLEAYHAPLQRVFAWHEIPFFMDRRESVSHHPLAELTRSALRTVARDWRHEDWFAALKSGLMPADEPQIDRLENEALARGWQGTVWSKPLAIAADPARAAGFEKLRKQLMPPFTKLALALGGRQGRPSGTALADALRAFWRALRVEEQLEAWAESMTTSTSRVLWPGDPAGAVHRTVWEQMNAWLENLERAFGDEPLQLSDWLPILDAGLGSLTVGVIPPALDQVRIGAVNRSRNPDVKLALVLGLNEGVFPARPTAGPLLTDTDMATLEQHGLALSSLPLQQIGREHFFGYVACTRARERLVFTAARTDAEGKPLNLSPFVARLKGLFPQLDIEQESWSAGLRPGADATAPDLDAPSRRPALQSATATLSDAPALEAVHVHELIPALLALPMWPADATRQRADSLPLQGVDASPFLDTLAHLRRHANVLAQDRLAPDLAARLYGAMLHTSVSRLEQFAACPFKFFVYAGLRAEERVRFEPDPREQGSFQHEVLALFHEQLRREGKRWRDVTPAEARERVGRIAAALATGFREGLFAVNEQTRFLARQLTGALQDFVEVLVDWMRGQYAFDPVAVELAFGEANGPPAWELDLGEGRRLALRGRIDRVDLCHVEGEDAALCVVVDYKSSQKELDPVLLANGVQLQLPAYLNALQHWPDPQGTFGVGTLQPAGVFYVSLRGHYGREQNRGDALADTDAARRLAYQHAGRFDAGLLDKLDRRGVPKGDQFNYRRNKDGSLARNCREPLSAQDFRTLLSATEENLRRMGQEIFCGLAQVAPYRHRQILACNQCSYQAICRIDPWTHRYRVLRATGERSPAEAGSSEPTQIRRDATGV